MYPHRIRLRSPWECEPLTEPPSPRRRVPMPCRLAEIGLTGFMGRVRFRRAFGFPGRIDEHERVWLTCAGVEGRAAVRLNEQLLGQELRGVFAFEVTALLDFRNRLEVMVEADSDQAGLWGEVALEIRAVAYLHAVRVYCRDDQLGIEGAVAGSWGEPLELYVVVGRFTAAYQTVRAGETFQIKLPVGDLAGAGQDIRVDLVNVATVWYTVVLPWPG